MEGYKKYRSSIDMTIAVYRGMQGLVCIVRFEKYSVWIYDDCYI